MSLRKDLRRHMRELRDAKVHLSWTDAQGVACVVTTRCRDISESGLGVTVRTEIVQGTYVNFRVEGAGLHGSASVRHCRKSRGGFDCGLEFTGGLRWSFSKPTTRDAVVPLPQEAPVLG